MAYDKKKVNKFLDTLERLAAKKEDRGFSHHNEESVIDSPVINNTAIGHHNPVVGLSTQTSNIQEEDKTLHSSLVSPSLSLSLSLSDEHTIIDNEHTGPNLLKFEKSDNLTEVYPGDINNEIAPSTEASRYSKFDFPDPSFVVCLFDKDLLNQTATLHPWQVEVSEELASVKATAQHPHKFCLVAANGSGKDKYVIAPFCVWFSLTKIRSRVILTSSSGVQLTSQTEGYIRDMAERVNAYFGEEIYKIRQRYIYCNKTGSEIRMFATDEKGKAEGYHPWDATSEMAIIVNEGKSVTEEIHGALRRCTGYNYWLEVSTPGEPHGFFYNAATHWKHKRRITSYDCPHLSEEDRDEDKRDLGENSALFRSKHLALFTSIGGQVIIPIDLINSIVENPPQTSYPSIQERIGIDIAAGGDENAICFTKGNKCRKEYSFREVDTTVTADRIERILKDEKIPMDYPFIFADGGGVGKGVIDMLRRKGWNINEIHNQWAALGGKKMFANRGAENWYRVKRLFEEFIFDASTLGEKTREQLASRHYKQNGANGRIGLESKKDAKAHGRPSPDRADAFILSMTGLDYDEFLKAEKFIDTTKAINTPYSNGKPRVILRDMEEAKEYVERQAYNEDRDTNTSASKRCFNSLRRALFN